MIIDIEITRIEPTKVALLEHRGPADLVNNSVNKFIAWRKATGLSPIASSKTFGIAYDDPATTKPAPSPLLNYRSPYEQSESAERI